jgi:hypothetical protein
VSDNIDTLKKFIASHIYDLSSQGEGGQLRDIPHFEIYPREYLRFAEQELQTSHDARNLINCIGHLKRAVECQIDILLHCFGLREIFQKRNLGIDKKLDFFRETKIAEARTLTKLNAIRNKMEHAYEVPKLRDIDVYFDLVTAFITILERTRLFRTELEFELCEDNREEGKETLENCKSYGGFSIKYDIDNLRILASWHAADDVKDLVADIGNIQEFIYFFKVFMLLLQLDTLSTYDDITLEL